MEVKTNYSAQPSLALRADTADEAQVQRLEAVASRRIEEPAQVEPSEPQVEEAVATLQNFMQSIQRNLDFSIDDSTGRTVVKVTDSVTGDVIRQLPSEEALRLAESLDEMRSLLFETHA